KAIEKEPRFADGHAGLAALLGSDEPELARTHWQQAIAFAASDSDVLTYSLQLVVVQRQLKDYEGALTTLRRIIELNPTSGNVRGWKRDIAIMRQKIDAAVRARSFRERLRHDGDVPIATLTPEWLRSASVE